LLGFFQLKQRPGTDPHAAVGSGETMLVE